MSYTLLPPPIQYMAAPCYPLATPPYDTYTTPPMSYTLLPPSIQYMTAPCYTLATPPSNSPCSTTPLTKLHPLTHTPFHYTP